MSRRLNAIAIMGQVLATAKNFEIVTPIPSATEEERLPAMQRPEGLQEKTQNESEVRTYAHPCTRHSRPLHPSNRAVRSRTTSVNVTLAVAPQHNRRAHLS